MKRSFEVVIRDGKAYVTGTVDGKPLVEDLEARMALEDQARLIDTLHDILARLRAALGVDESEPAIDRARELVDAEKVLKAKGLAREEFEAKQRRISDLEREVARLQGLAASRANVIENTRATMGASFDVALETSARDLKNALSAAQVENARLKRELEAAVDYHAECGKKIEEALDNDAIDDFDGPRFERFAASIRRLRQRRDGARQDVQTSRDASTAEHQRADQLRLELTKARAELVEWRRYWEQQHAVRIAERDEAYERASKARRELIAALADARPHCPHDEMEAKAATGVEPEPHSGETGVGRNANIGVLVRCARCKACWAVDVTAACPMFEPACFDLKTLQVRLPWTIKYSGDFRANPQSHKDFAHALLHVTKASGMLAMFVDKMDHDRDAALDTDKRVSFAPYVADLVVCALRLANTFPGGPIDLERAVVERIESKNGVQL